MSKFYIIVMQRFKGRDGPESESESESEDLLKKLFMRREVLVLMDCSLLPEGRVSVSL